MRKPMLFLAFFGLSLGGCTLGSEGVLGQGRFFYYCVDDSDPKCDYETFDQLCGFWCEDDHTMPLAVAVGSRFRVRCDPDGYGWAECVPTSPSMLSGNSTEFQALRPGEVAILARESGWVVDYYYVRISAPEQVRVDLYDSNGLVRANVDQVEVSTGSSIWLRAMSVDEMNQILSGAQSCSWSMDSGAVARFDTFRSDNMIQVTADASGTTTVHVTLGVLDADVELTVLGSSGRGEGGTP